MSESCLKIALIYGGHHFESRPEVFGKYLCKNKADHPEIWTIYRYWRDCSYEGSGVMDFFPAKIWKVISLPPWEARPYNQAQWKGNIGFKFQGNLWMRLELWPVKLHPSQCNSDLPVTLEGNREPRVYKDLPSGCWGLVTNCPYESRPNLGGLVRPPCSPSSFPSPGRWLIPGQSQIHPPSLEVVQGPSRCWERRWRALPKPSRDPLRLTLGGHRIQIWSWWITGSLNLEFLSSGSLRSRGSTADAEAAQGLPWMG